MMEKNLRTILEKLEMVIKDRKVVRVSLLLCVVLSIIIFIATLVELDDKPEYNATNKELFDVAEAIVKENLEISSIKDDNYIITTEERIITLSKKDNSLASIMGCEPKVIISFNEDGTYMIKRNYLEEKDYDKDYVWNVIFSTVIVIISLTAILYVLEIMITFICYIIVTAILNTSIDVNKSKQQKVVYKS